MGLAAVTDTARRYHPVIAKCWSIMALNLPRRRTVLRVLICALSLTLGLVPAAATADGTPDGLIVIAEIVAKPRSVDVVREALKTLAAAARHEPGCRSYALLEDRATAGRFMTYEIWASKADLAAHMKAPAIKAATPKVAGLLSAAPKQTLLNVLR